MFSQTKQAHSKSLADYKELKPLSDSDSFRKKFIGEEKIASRPQNPLYDDRWYLLMREGLYRAQIEKAMSEIYHLFMGYSTDVEIIKDDEDYYVASRSISNSKSWMDCVSLIQVDKDGNILVTDPITKKSKILQGLGHISALSRFVADNDAHTGNFILHENADKYQTVKIDNEKSFNFKDEKEEGDCDLEDELKLFSNEIAITEALSFKKEKQEMLKKIAFTDFSIIESILRKHITTTQLESAKWTINHVLKSQMDCDKASLLIALKQLEQEDENQYNINNIIKQLSKRHIELRRQFEAEKIYDSKQFPTDRYNLFSHSQPEEKTSLSLKLDGITEKAAVPIS